MNNARALVLLGLLAAGVLVVSSCGGGQTASGGSGGTGMMARGAVTQTGTDKVGVNNVTYRTSTAIAAGLRTGMVVTVSGSVDADGVNGEADSVIYTRTVVGRMMLHPGGSGADGFTVYGQNITYHMPVTFEDNTGDLVTTPAAVPLWVNDHEPVEVSGFVLADGTVEASYVKRLAESDLVDGEDIEFVGMVTDTTAAPVSIKVNGMVVELPGGYDWGSEPVAVGDYVHVHAKAPADHTIDHLSADQIDVEDMDLGGGEGDEGEIEGIVSGLDAGKTSMSVAGQWVDITAQTRFDEGATLAALANGMHVEVEGHFTGGQFVADEIEFE